MPGIEDQPPSVDEIAEIRQKVREYCDENGSENFDPLDLQRLMTEDKYVARFFMHQWDMPGEQLENAYQMVIDSFKWRQVTNVRSITQDTLSESLKMRGNLYIHNKDKDNKTLLVFNVKNHKRGEENADDLKAFFCYLLERVDRETDGDKLTLVFDCAGCGLKNMDMELIQYMINVFKEYYPSNLNYILVFDMPWVLNAAWRIIKSWLPAAAVKKIKFLTKSNIGEYVDEDQRLVAWGGTDDWEYEFIEEAEKKMNNNDGLEGDVGDGDQGVKRPQTLELVNGDGNDDSVVYERKNVTFSSPAAETSTPVHQLQSQFSDVSSIGSSPMTGKGILDIKPSEEIVFEPNVATNSLVAKIQIGNASSKTVVFKIKTTSPDKYRVRPSTSYIKINDTCQVEIHVHQSQLNDNVTESADIQTLLTTEQSASLLKDKFLVTAITIEDDSDFDLSYSKLTEIMKNARPEAQYRLKCNLSGISKSSVQSLRQLGSGEKMPNSSTLANANKQLETLAKKVNVLNQTVTDLQEVVVNLKKVLFVLIAIIIFVQVVVLYKETTRLPPDSLCPAAEALSTPPADTGRSKDASDL